MILMGRACAQPPAPNCVEGQSTGRAHGVQVAYGELMDPMGLEHLTASTPDMNPLDLMGRGRGRDAAGVSDCPGQLRSNVQSNFSGPRPVIY